MAPIAATWNKPLTAGGTPIMVHGEDPCLLGGNGLDPSIDPDVLHGKLDLLQIDVIGVILVYS